MPNRILVVDDEDGLRATLAANLELEGYEVATAEDGAGAVAQVAARRVAQRYGGDVLVGSRAVGGDGAAGGPGGARLVFTLPLAGAGS